jgi:small subunit ribosomal protein S5
MITPRIQKKSEYEERVIEIRRVSRVMKGGKRMSFRATVVVGNRAGKVGVGIAKGLDVAASIDKAKRQAIKNIILLNLKEGRTIPYDVDAKYCAARIRMKPARHGHGLIAGGSARIVFELAGVKDISSKILGRTTNKLTNALAAIEGLKMTQILKK